MRIAVVCVACFFAFTDAKTAASESRRNDGNLFSVNSPGQHIYKYNDEDGHFLTSSTEKINEDGSKSLIYEREIMEKAKNNTYIMRVTEEKIIDQQNSNVIKTIYTRVVQNIDDNNPNKSTYETYRSVSNPNSQKNSLFGDDLPASNMFKPRELGPHIPVGDLNVNLTQNEFDFTQHNKVPTPSTSDGNGTPSEQANVMNGAISPQSESGAGSSQLNPTQHYQVRRPETPSRSRTPSQQAGGMSEANVPQYTPGQERLQSISTQYNQVSRTDALSRSRAPSQQEGGMNGPNTLQHTSAPGHYQPAPTNYNQVPRPKVLPRSRAPSQQAGGMSGANIPQYTPGQESLQSYPSQYNQVPRPEDLSRSRAPSQQEGGMNEANPPQHTSGPGYYQQAPTDYNQILRPATGRRNRAQSHLGGEMSGANLPQYTPGQEGHQPAPQQSGGMSQADALRHQSGSEYYQQDFSQYS